MHTPVIMLPDLPTAGLRGDIVAIKVKGQTLNNGEVIEFVDVDAPKSAELTDQNVLVFKNSAGEIVFTVDLSTL